MEYITEKEIEFCKNELESRAFTNRYYSIVQEKLNNKDFDLNAAEFTMLVLSGHPEVFDNFPLSTEDLSNRECIRNVITLNPDMKTILDDTNRNIRTLINIEAVDQKTYGLSADVRYVFNEYKFKDWQVKAISEIKEMIELDPQASLAIRRGLGTSFLRIVDSLFTSTSRHWHVHHWGDHTAFALRPLPDNPIEDITMVIYRRSADACTFELGPCRVSTQSVFWTSIMSTIYDRYGGRSNIGIGGSQVTDIKEIIQLAPVDWESI